MNDPAERGPGLDREPYKPGFGPGGVPVPLLLFYLSFLVFFTWYVLEHQLPNYLEMRASNAAEAEAGAPSAPGPELGDGG